MFFLSSKMVIVELEEYLAEIYLSKLVKVTDT